MIMLIEERRDDRRTATRNDRTGRHATAAVERVLAVMAARLLAGEGRPAAGAWAGLAA